MPRYVMVFDAATNGFRGWPLLLIFLVLVAISLGYALEAKFVAHMRTSVLGAVICAGLAFAFLLVFLYNIYDHWTFAQALERGTCEIVEGSVTKFIPMPASGRGQESFDVNGHHYLYSYVVCTPSFNQTVPRGGPMREGLQVRIHDMGGRIARLEIAD